MAINTTREKAAANLRRFLRDRPEMNKLLGREEHEPEDLELAIDASVDLFNIAPPISIGRYTAETHPSFYLLVMGAVVWLLRSAGLAYTKNKLAYSDQGVTVTVNDKGPEYSQWAAQLIGEFDKKATILKGQLNINSVGGGISSEYASTDFWWGR